MNLRNIAIIAHVDHGKTTLVDRLLQQSGTFRDNQRVAERAMDSNDLERERGITILAKATSVQWKDTRINIVDTPGHADFGGEVERILYMVDGALVLVDAAEGPMPQTKFVVAKALKVGLKPIVVINKVDRPDARPTEVINEVFDLFAALDATDEQLDFPILYGSAKQGWMATTPGGPAGRRHAAAVRPGPAATSRRRRSRKARSACSAPSSKPTPISAASSPAASPRARSSRTRRSRCSARDGKLVETGRITKILAFRGIERTPIEEAEAGDIVAIAGLSKGTVADTFCDPSVETPLPGAADRSADPVDVVHRQRLPARRHRRRQGDRAASSATACCAKPKAMSRCASSKPPTRIRWKSSGRGELQLGDPDRDHAPRRFRALGVASARRADRRTKTGELLEPIEEVVIDVDEEHSGVVVQKMSERKAEMIEMRPSGGNRLRLVFYAPTRGLIGYQGELLTDTRGTAIMNRLFHDYAPYKGEIQGRRNGVLISNDQGEAVAYAMLNLEDRGPMMIEPGWKVYKGMIVGEHTRDNDLEVNVLKGKQLTNIRTTSKDEAVRLTPPIRMTLEKALAYIEDDELVEVTPKSIRLRKKYLDPNDRKRAEKAKEAVA